MKKLSFLIITVIIALSTFAQVSKVAVFDPEDQSNTGYKDVIREVLSTGITKSTHYKPVERALINKVLKENSYQKTGMVDENEISKLGKQMGADFVCISMLKKIGNDFFITAKLVNVTTASVEFQEYVKTNNGERDLFEKIEILANKLSSAKSSIVSNIELETETEILPIIELNFQTYMVLPKDLSGKYTWEQAKEACENLIAFGFDDWTLPSKSELAALYDNRKTIGGFQDGEYCSSTSNFSTIHDKYNYEYYDFNSGSYYKTSVTTRDFYVRCIRKEK